MKFQVIYIQTPAPFLVNFGTYCVSALCASKERILVRCPIERWLFSRPSVLPGRGMNKILMNEMPGTDSNQLTMAGPKVSNNSFNDSF